MGKNSQISGPAIKSIKDLSKGYHKYLSQQKTFENKIQWVGGIIDDLTFIETNNKKLEN